MHRSRRTTSIGRPYKLTSPRGLSRVVDQLKGLESADEEGYQTFALDFVPAGEVVDRVQIEILGTVDGEDAFMLLDAKIYGSIVDNPTNVYQVKSSRLVPLDCQSRW